MRFLAVSGMGRSGGSLLARLLDGHPAIASFPYEPRFGKVDLRRHRKLSESFPDPLAGSLEDVLRHHHRLDHAMAIVSGSQSSKNAFPDYDQAYFRQALRQPLPQGAGPGDFIEAFAKALFLSHPYYRGRWHDVRMVAWHSSMSQLWSDDLLAIEGLHLLYVVRHPLDVLASYLNSKGRKVPITPEIELLAWCDCILRIACSLERAPERVTVVRYEDMVSDVDAFAARLASAIGVADSPHLRRPTLLGAEWAGNSSYQRYRTVSTESIGRFERYFSADQIARGAEILDGWLEPLGYTVGPPYYRSQFSVASLTAEKDPLQVSRDLILYCESRFKAPWRDVDRDGIWPDPYREVQSRGMGTALRKKAGWFLRTAAAKGRRR